MANKESKKKTSQVKETKSIGFSTKGKRVTSLKTAEPAPKKKRSLSKKQWKIIIAITLSVVLVAGIITGTALLIYNHRNPNFLKANLSKYIYISEDDYTGYDVNVPLDTVTEADLVRAVNVLRTSKKTPNEKYKGGYMNNLAMSLGDEAHIYYRGYTLDEKGREVDFAGSSNFSKGEHTVIEVGTGIVFEDGEQKPFITGFGESLVGVVPNEHNNFTKITTGEVAEGDVIYLSYTIINEGKNKTVSSERIDLSLPYIDEIYGKGFKEFFLGKTTDTETKAPQKIGEILTEQPIFRIEGESTDTFYYNLKIDYVTRCETNPHTIKVRFPASYHEESLRGVEAFFDVYVTYAQIYDVPEFDDKFITESLKVKAEELSAYEGETLADKYRAKLSAEIAKETEESNHNLREEKMWEYLKGKAEVKKLPQGSVQTYYDSYYRNLALSYENNYASAYENIDAYIRAVYGLGEGEDWREHLTELAETAVIEKLIFYYIIREAELLPPEDEYNRIYEQIFNEHLEYHLDLHKEEFSKLEGEDYERELEVLRSEVSTFYGDKYFEENVYYYYCTRKMLELAAES